MQILTEDFLNEKITATKQLLEQFDKYVGSISETELEKNPGDDKWSIAEILEHLNLYADHYNPALETAIGNLSSSELEVDENYKQRRLGKWFTNMMAPKSGIVKMKMNTPKDKNPFNVGVRANVVDAFKEQQARFLELIESAKGKNINYVNVPTTLPKLKFSVGDTFNFLVKHNQRHMVQIMDVLSTT